MNRLVALVCFSLLLCAGHALAQDDALQRLHERLQAAESLSGRFVQRLYDRDEHLLQETQGHFVVERPGNFYWETDPPYEQVVVGNPDKLWIYDPDLEQVTVRRRDERMQATPARLLSGDLQTLSEHYTVTTRAQDGMQRFLLESKGDNETFDSMRLDYRDGLLTALAFEDRLGQVTQLVLSDVERNPAIEDGLFEFQAPPGTDVIVDD